jgi:hypothetical protein
MARLDRAILTAAARGEGRGWCADPRADRIGLVLPALFVGVARLTNRSRGTRIDGAFLFIWAWLVATLANSAGGYLEAGFPLLTEAIAFLATFSPPAVALGWFRADFGARRPIRLRRPVDPFQPSKYPAFDVQKDRPPPCSMAGERLVFARFCRRRACPDGLTRRSKTTKISND